MEREIDNERNKLILELFALGNLIHEETDYCVFMSFSGHVDSFEIDIRESKKQWRDVVCTADIKTRFLELYHKDKNDHLAHMKAKRDIFKMILKDREIPTHLMDENIEYITTYSF